MLNHHRQFTATTNHRHLCRRREEYRPRREEKENPTKTNNHNRENIPLDSIDIFWRKLDISDTTSVVDDDINCDDVVDKFKENFKKQSKAGKMFYKRKLEEIYDPYKTDVREPMVQKEKKNTHGRPSVKKQQKKKANPPNHAPRRCNFSTTSEFNGVNFNKEPERHSFSCGTDLNDEPQRHSFSCKIDLNDEPPKHYPFQMNCIPDIFHDYIDDIQDVEGDGIVGFNRSVEFSTLIEFLRVC
ncbi:unnamed protein product [Lactuca saligna]|uniref:Uncharacterized protein n=1 Tax=Lactuca saligna TaxID=75948 RepID=A0AA35VPF0_LACSI|nr:unnamed protein product [Lactuca saligna]